MLWHIQQLSENIEQKIDFTIHPRVVPLFPP